MSLLRNRTHDYVPVAFSSLVDKFFNENLVKSGGSTFMPAVDISETDKAYELHLAVPGMKKEDFQIELSQGNLVIRGERKFSEENQGKTYHSIGTAYGSFSRSFSLPEHAAVSKIEANYNNGILHIVIPKDQEKSLRTSIKVN
jgi:HSP20 family protein